MSLNNACISIQKIYRSYKIKQYIKKLNYRKTIIKSNTFDEFTKKIQNKNILNLVNTILKKIFSLSKNRVKSIKAQEFLSAFIIYGYPDDVIDNDMIKYDRLIINPQNNINKQIKIISERIIGFTEYIFTKKINAYIIDIFSEALLEYKETFDKWKIIDKNYLIHILTTSYYELNYIKESIAEKETTEERNANIISYIDYINLCNERQADIFNKIKFLGGEEYFNNYREPEIVIDELLESRIRINLEKAFWNRLYEELNESPAKSNTLITLLVDLRDAFCNLVPNRKDIHREIYDKIDTESIKNMIDNNAFDDENLYNLAVYIISLIKQFQPPIMDEKVNLWEEQMLKQFQQKFDYSEFLMIFFQSVFNMIETIIFYTKKVAQDLNV